MATLREIRRQLHSIVNIQKITQAMEMVAASRLRRAQTSAEKSRPYFQKLKEMLGHLIAVAEDFRHPLINKRAVKKFGVIVIAGDRGLCGAYNNSVFSSTEKLLKNYPVEQIELILVGRKAIDYFSGKKWKIGLKIAEWGGKITFQQIEVFTKNVIDQYLTEQLDEVWLIYTHFIHAMARQVTVEQLLAIDSPSMQTKSTPTSYIFEPGASEILAEILPRYVTTKVQLALNEAYASELSARIFSMRAATKNADEMIVNLTLVRNKIRQSSITRELIEITSSTQ